MADPIIPEGDVLTLSPENERMNTLYTGSADLAGQPEQEYALDQLTATVRASDFKAKNDEAMLQRRNAQATDWELMVKGGEDGFKDVASRRGFLENYESANPLIGGDQLRKRLVRDLFVQDVTGADGDALATGVPQLQVAKGLFGLDDASDEAFDKSFDGFIDKQITFRANAEKIYELSSRGALDGTPWADTVAEATKLAGGDLSQYEEVFNKGRSDLFQLLRPQDIQTVNKLWGIVGKNENKDTKDTAGGDDFTALADYEAMTPQQREAVMQGIAMRAQAEGEDVDGAFNRVAAAMRSGFAGIASGLVSSDLRTESDSLKRLIERGQVPADTGPITQENMVRVANTQTLPESGGLALNPNREFRPLTDGEKKLMGEVAQMSRGYARFLQDVRGAGVKAKEYRREKTQGGWFFGDSLENTVVNLAESVPSMAVTAIPVTGPAIMLTSYAEQERARLEAKFPGADEATIAAQSLATGAWMAGADIIQNKLFASKIPKLNATLLKLGKPGGVALFAGRAVTTGGLETLQEVGQDAGSPIIQQIAAALDSDIKGPEWGEWLEQEYNSLGDIFRVSMLMGIVGGAGSTISDYMVPSKLKETLQDRQMLRLNGLNPKDVDDIAKTAETNPAAAAQLLQAAQATTAPEVRQANAKAEFQRQELETASTTLREAGLPELLQQDDGKVIVRYNDGVTNDRLFDTPEEAKADMDSVFTGQQVEMARVNRELIEELEGSYNRSIGPTKIETSEVKSSSLAQAIETGETTVEIGRQRARIYLRNAKDQMGVTDPADDTQIDSILGRLMIQGASRNQYADGVTKMVLQIRDGAKPTVVFEEAIEAIGKWMLDKGGVTPEKMYGWIRETESKTKTQILPEDFSGLSSDLMFQELIEGWSRIGVAHATGRIQDSQLSQAIKDFFKAIRQMISDVLQLAAKVREFTDSKDIDPEFRSWLDRAAGFDTEGEIANQQAIADAEVSQQINESFSVSPAEDAAYMKAVESGDMESAQRMVDEAAKAAGYSGPWHHGGESWEKSDRPVWISESRSYSEKVAKRVGGEVADLYFQEPNNPLGVDSDRAPAAVIEAAKADQKDGVTGKGFRVIFNPSSLKSAEPVTRDSEGKVIPLSQRFNPEDDRITFAVTAQADPISAALDNFKKNPEAFVKFSGAARVALADVARRASVRAINSNLRQRDFDQFRDMAKLEAIARALPGEIRGILTSEFRRVAEMRTTEGREAYIAKLLPKVEQALEKHTQKVLRKEIKKALKKGAVKVSDAKTRGGKSGGVAHAIFEEAQRAIKLTDNDQQSALQQADEMAEKIRDQMEGKVTDEQLEELDGRVAALELFGDYEAADSARLTEALDLLKGVYAQGRAERLEVLKARKEERQRRVEAVLKGLDRQGPLTDAQRNAAKRKFSKFFSGLDEGILQAGLSGSQKFRRLSEATDDPATKAVAEELEFAALEAELAEQDANEADNIALGQAMRSIFGVKTEYGVSKKLRDLTTPEVAPVEKAEGKISDKTIKVPIKFAEAIASGQATGFDRKSGERVELTPEQIEEVQDAMEDFDPEAQSGVRSVEVSVPGESGNRQTIGEISQLEGLQLWLTMRQSDQFAKLESMGYDQETMDQLDSWLKPETKALGLWMVNRIGEEAFTIDQLHRSEKGVGLRLVDQYFPVRNDVSGADNNGLSIDGSLQSTGKSITFNKERVKNNAPPAYVNAVAVFLANRAQVNFWKSHVAFLREWGGVIKDERFAAGVKNRMGETYYRSLQTTMKRIEAGGALNAAALMDWEKIVRKMTSNFALATLGGRVSTLAINTTAALNGLLEIPGSELLKGLGDVLSRPEAFKDAFSSPAMQRRFKTGGTYEAQLARAQGLSTHPILAALGAAAQYPVSLITKVDTGSQIIGSAIAWEYTRKQALASGMSEEMARAEADKKVERIFLRAAQPTTRLAKSELELVAADRPLAALFTLFVSEPRKNLAIGYMAARELITGKGNYGKAMAAQQLFTVMLVQTTAAFLIRTLYQSLVGAKDNEDEELSKRLEKRMDPKAFAYSLATEHLKAVPLIGEIYNKAMAGILGQPSFDSSQNFLNQVTQKGWSFAEKILDEEKTMTNGEMVDGGIDAAQSFGSVLPGGQVFAQAANVAEFVEGVLSSNVPETLSKEDRIKRIKSRMSLLQKEYREEFGAVSGEDGKIDKDKQKARNAVLADRLKQEILPLTPDLQRETLDALDVSDSVIKKAGFKVEKKK